MAQQEVQCYRSRARERVRATHRNPHPKTRQKQQRVLQMHWHVKDRCMKQENSSALSVSFDLCVRKCIYFSSRRSLKRSISMERHYNARTFFLYAFNVVVLMVVVLLLLCVMLIALQQRFDIYIYINFPNVISIYACVCIKFRGFEQIH